MSKRTTTIQVDITGCTDTHCKSNNASMCPQLLLGSDGYNWCNALQSNVDFRNRLPLRLPACIAGERGRYNPKEALAFLKGLLEEHHPEDVENWKELEAYLVEIGEGPCEKREPVMVRCPHMSGFCGGCRHQDDHEHTAEKYRVLRLFLFTKALCWSWDVAKKGE